jgi:hypothetical protein
MSYFNPDYLDVYLQGRHVSLATMAKRIDDAEDERITKCLKEDRLDKDDECVSSFRKLQDNTLAGLHGESLVQLTMQHKYALHLDGETAPWLVLPMQLLAGMVVLKPDTPNHQWFYAGLVPYKHYIPVKSDLSDLLMKIDWLKHNEEEAKSISKHAQ